VRKAKATPPRKKPAVAPSKPTPGTPKDGFHLGARLKHARLLHQMRLRDIAERAGCSESMLSKIENELASPSLTTLHRLCKALTLSV
jgi:DNA-binding XRE family transcriptional regulator